MMMMESDPRGPSVAYSESILANALAFLLSQTQLASPQSNSYQQNMPVDVTINSVASNFECELYVYSPGGSTGVVYNYADYPKRAKIYIERTDTTLTIVPTATGMTFARYVPLSAASSDVEMVEGRDLFNSTNLEYNIVRNDASKYDMLPSNIRPATPDEIKSPLKERNVDNFDLIIKCDNISNAAYVFGFSNINKVVFNASIAHLDRRVLKIPAGLGVCIVSNVSDLLILDKWFNPIEAYSLYGEIFSFVNEITDIGITRATDNPLINSTQDAIDYDIESKYSNLTVGGVERGECYYNYTAKDKSAVPETSTLSYIQSQWGVADTVLESMSSKLCVSLGTLERIIPFLGSAITPEQSLIYGTIHHFRTFLYKIGYDGGFPAYETLSEAYRVYQKIKNINANMSTADGTLEVDMSPLQQQGLADSVHLTFEDGIEMTSGIRYEYLF